MAVFQVLTTFDVAASAFLTALEGAPAAAPAAPLKKGSAVPPLPSASSARHAQALLSRGRAAAARKASRLELSWSPLLLRAYEGRRIRSLW